MNPPDWCCLCGKRVFGFYTGFLEPPHDCGKPNKVLLHRNRQLEVRIKAHTIVGLPSGELFWQIFGRYILANELERGGV